MSGKRSSFVWENAALEARNKKATTVAMTKRRAKIFLFDKGEILLRWIAKLWIWFRRRRRPECQAGFYAQVRGSVSEMRTYHLIEPSFEVSIWARSADP